MRLGALCILWLSAAAPFSAAQGEERCSGALDLRTLAAKDAPLGSWSEYVPYTGGKPIPALGFRVLSVEAPWEGRPRRWLEFWFDRSGADAMRVTAQGDPEILVLKRGPRFFTLPPDSGTAAPSGSCSPPEASAGFDLVSVKTPAGVFQCRHRREARNGRSVELWASDDVQPLQLVKSFYSGGFGYELVGRGSGAVSVFPVRFTAAALPAADLIDGLLPVDPQAKRTPTKAGAERGGDAGVRRGP